MRDGILAMILVEQRATKRQQDFVDLGQTEPIKPTIKIHMDWRQPEHEVGQGHGG